MIWYQSASLFKTNKKPQIKRLLKPKAVTSTSEAKTDLKVCHSFLPSDEYPSLKNVLCFLTEMSDIWSLTSVNFQAQKTFDVSAVTEH